jgi:hypothetical protein
MADARRIDLTVFSQAKNLNVMQIAALKALLKTQRPPSTHATMAEWERWLKDALETVVTT